MTTSGERVLWRGRATWSVAREVVVALADTEPPDELTAAAMALAFDDERRFLMTKEVDRGWDIPGGHREPGETLEQCLRRETYEETAAVLAEVRPFAHFRFVHDGQPPPGWRYPWPVGFMAFFLARVERLDPFVPDEESEARALLPPDEARRSRWVLEPHNTPLYEAALEASSRSGSCR